MSKARRFVPAYAGGDYTASSGTWTVDAGDVIGVSSSCAGAI